MFGTGLTVANLVGAHGLQNRAAIGVGRGNPAKMIMQVGLNLPLRFHQETHAPFVTQ